MMDTNEIAKRLAKRRGVRLLGDDGRPHVIRRTTGRAHKAGQSFRLDGRPVLCLGREPGAPPRTYLFALILAVEHDQRREDAAEAARVAYVATRDATIPAGYLRRHGALDGGEYAIGSERGLEPRVGAAPAVPWREVARCEIPGIGLCAGRVAESAALSEATLPDGRTIYREIDSRGYGDDARSTYWMPRDVWRAAADAEIRGLGITPDSAREWLASYAGCVGHELYEYAASGELPQLAITGAADAR